MSTLLDKPSGTATKATAKSTPTMVWPSEKAIQGALLLVVRSLGGQVVLKDQKEMVLKLLADHFGLSQRQRRLPHRTAGTKWSNKVQWAKLGLVHDGKLDGDAPKGTWTVVGFKPRKPTKPKVVKVSR